MEQVTGEEVKGEEVEGRIVIEGITRSGRVFRPSDWAQRLTTAVATLDADRHIRFHPRVHMVTRDGVNCVVIDVRLRQEDPMLFEFLLDFARSNDLRVDGLET